MTRRSISKRQRGAALAEFGPVLWVFLVLILIPIIDLIGFASAVGSVIFVSTFGARAVEGAQTYGDALNSLAALEKQVQPFLAMSRTTPGFGSTGIQLAVSVSPVDGSQGPPLFTAPGNIPNMPADPNNPNVPQYNTGNCVYQYLVTCDYNVLPLFNFNVTPFFHDVPALGQPVPVKYVSTATVEHPEGLNLMSMPNGQGNAAPAGGPGQGGKGPSTPPGPSGGPNSSST